MPNTPPPPPPAIVYSALQQPAAMSDVGNLAVNWREWKSAFDYFLIASGKDNAQPREKSALFLHVIGRAGREILEELDLTDGQKNDYATLVEKYAQHCDPATNVNYERHVFFGTHQNDDSFDKFLGNLKVKSKTCEFGELRSSLILTQIIRGIKDPGMREKLLAKHKLGLKDAVQWCRAAEAASKQAEECARDAGAAAAAAAPTIEAMGARRRRPAGQPARGQGGSQQRSQPRAQQRAPAAQAQAARRVVCDRCGRSHGPSDVCSARNIECYRCNRVGHFAKCCQSKFVHEAKEENTEDDISESMLYSLSVDTVEGSCESWYEIISVNGAPIKFKLDSGADVSVLSLGAFKEAGFQEKILLKDKMVLREISKSKLPSVGYFEPMLCYKDSKVKQKVYVLNIPCNNLLSLEACKKLNLIARINEMSSLRGDDSIYEGIGCLPNICKIVVDENVAPVVNASRKIPMKVRPRLKDELDDMVKLEIIVKEEGPTDWVSNIVVVEKPNGKLRLCLDPCHLNKAVRRCHFQLPTLDEIASNLEGAKYFTKLDAKNGFWMLRLDEASSKLCTFATPFGRYRFLRMPFGINCAPEIFHHEMHKIFSMPGVETYCDDLLIWGHTKAEHDSRVKETIERARKNGVKFNKQKCLFGVKEVNFLGHIFSSEGIRPDEGRIKAILAMPLPSEKKELERFLGIANYLSRFIPNYSQVSSPLRDLLKKDTEFEWGHVQDAAYGKLKNLLTEAPVLRYYSPHEPIVLTVDASSRGLGACLLQGGRPVAYAARTLTATEQRWAQIEKELLAIVFGCVRFHQYIYGQEVVVESDHKPLETIFKKALNETPARLQRMLLKLQAYSLHIVYKQGKQMYIADALSRAAVERGVDSEVGEDVTVHVNALYSNMSASDEKLERIRTETSKDAILSCVIEYYYKGWPNNKDDVRVEGRPFWSMKHELHVINGILFRNNTIVIPRSLRKEMVDRIHEGHLGIEKSKRRARDTVWWPGMGADVEQAVRRCEPCARHQNAQRRQPLAPHAVPGLPWEALAADIFELKNKYYLLVVDYYSKYVEVVSLPNLQSGTVILKIKCILSRFGIPKKLVTDNGTQFSSAEFKNFVNKWEIEHVTSSPLYPRSNGLAERNVQTIKKLLIKASEDGTEWQLALLNFRNTPISGEDTSPAQLLMGRSLNTRLPASTQTLMPRIVEPSVVQKVRQAKVDKMKTYHDKGARDLKPLEPGDDIRVREGKVWTKASVLSRARGDRSYWLKVDNGGTYRRNRSHIYKPRQSVIDFEDRAGPSMAASAVPTQSSATATSRNDGLVATSSGRIVRPPNRLIYK